MKNFDFTKLLLCAAVALSSCGPAYHLKQAIKKGGKIKSDTIYQEIITEKTVKDTVVSFVEVAKIFSDTIEVETTRWRTWTKFDTVSNTIFQKVECKPDTVRVPTVIKQTISAGYSGWQILGVILFGLVVGALVGRIAWK